MIYILYSSHPKEMNKEKPPAVLLNWIFNSLCLRVNRAFFDTILLPAFFKVSQSGSTSTPCSFSCVITVSLTSFFSKWYCSTLRKIKSNYESLTAPSFNVFEINLLIKRRFASAREMVFLCFVIFLFKLLPPMMNPVDTIAQTLAKPTRGRKVVDTNSNKVVFKENWCVLAKLKIPPIEVTSKPHPLIANLCFSRKELQVFHSLPKGTNTGTPWDFPKEVIDIKKMPFSGKHFKHSLKHRVNK